MKKGSKKLKQSEGTIVKKTKKAREELGNKSARSAERGVKRAKPASDKGRTGEIPGGSKTAGAKRRRAVDAEDDDDDDLAVAEQSKKRKPRWDEARKQERAAQR